MCHGVCFSLTDMLTKSFWRVSHVCMRFWYHLFAGLSAHHHVFSIGHRPLSLNTLDSRKMTHLNSFLRLVSLATFLLAGSMAGGSRVLRVAVEGCCHGELEQVGLVREFGSCSRSVSYPVLFISQLTYSYRYLMRQIYASITRMEEATGKKVDLLICCGDFQAVRNKADLRCMAVPQKYLTMVRQ